MVLNAGHSWNVSVPNNVYGKLGSAVTINCTFTYPENQHTDNVQVYWKTPRKSNITVSDKDKNSFVFHTNEELVLQEYRGKTRLIGNKTQGDCSLEIVNIMQNSLLIYMRVIAKSDNYSFTKNIVRINGTGKNFTKTFEIWI